MRRAIVAAALLLGFLTSRAAADDANDAIRRDFDALIRRIECGPQPDSDSPTAIVNRLLSSDEAKLRDVLEEAWRIAGPKGGWGSERFFSVRWTIRLLYGKVTRAGWNEADDPLVIGPEGVVRIRGSDGRGTFCGNCNIQHRVPPAVAELIAGGKRPSPPVVDAAAALSLLERELEERREYEPYQVRPDVEDLARALGEAASGADLSHLIEVAARPDAPAPLLTALAWSRVREAVPILRSRIERASVRVAGAEPETDAMLAVACRGLAHADRVALTACIAKLEPPRQDAALRAAGLDLAEPFFVRWLTEAKDAEPRTAALGRMTRILDVRGGQWALHIWPFIDLARPVAPSAAAFWRMLSVCARERKSAPDSPALRTLEDVLVNGDRDTSARRAMSCGDIHCDAAEIPPFPSSEAAIDVLESAVRRGTLRLSEHWVSAFDDQIQDDGDSSDSLRSAVSWPSPTLETMHRSFAMFGGWNPGHVAVSGTPVPDGIRLSFRNESDDEIAFDPVSMKLATVHRAVYRTEPATDATPDFRVLEIVLGWTELTGTVAAESLVVVGPGRSYECVVSLSPEDRGAEHVSVGLRCRFEVRGKPAARVISRTGSVLVR